MGNTGGKIPEGDVNFKHFEILRVLGKGAFGKVHAVIFKVNRELYAMKCLDKGEILRKNKVKSVLEEAQILKQLEHPYLVNLRFAFQTPETLYMIVDLMGGGDLRYHLEKKKRFDEVMVVLYAAQLGLALEYLHEKRVVHRDLKPENMLLDEKGNVHLTDFNVSVQLKDHQLAKVRAGTYPYMSPEVISREPYSFSADWWSLGVVLYEWLCGQRPFAGQTVEDLQRDILRKKIMFPAFVSPEARDLLAHLLRRDVKKRMSFISNGFRTHAFFTKHNIDWEAVLAGRCKAAFVPEKNRAHCSPYFEMEDQFKVKSRKEKLTEAMQAEFAVWDFSFVEVVGRAQNPDESAAAEKSGSSSQPGTPRSSRKHHRRKEDGDGREKSSRDSREGRSREKPKKVHKDEVEKGEEEEEEEKTDTEEEEVKPSDAGQADEPAAEATKSKARSKSDGEKSSKASEEDDGAATATATEDEDEEDGDEEKEKAKKSSTEAPGPKAPAESSTSEEEEDEEAKKSSTEAPGAKARAESSDSEASDDSSESSE